MYYSVVPGIVADQRVDEGVDKGVDRRVYER
jgi:hypothetical protein